MADLESMERLEEKVQLQEAKENMKYLDAGFWIAVLAILISSATAFISLWEARIMKEQQQILMDQKNASAWPYVNVSGENTYDSEANTVKVVNTIENKGVGPALLGDIKYSVDGYEVETYSYLDKLEELYPDLNISFNKNHQINHMVLSSGEAIEFLTFKIHDLDKLKDKDINISRILNETRIKLDFCYCSIYKDCWQHDQDKKGEYDPCE